MEHAAAHVACRFGKIVRLSVKVDIQHLKNAAKFPSLRLA